MTEPTPTPQQQAVSLAETYKRWADELTTIEITRGPHKAMPVPDETRYWDEPVEGEDDEE